MVTIFTSPSCMSCRKARQWLRDFEIPYRERNIFTDQITIAEIKLILRLTENGTEDIISTRSKAYQQLQKPIEELSLNDLCRMIQRDPSILRRPIIVDDRRIQVGYNDDEIRRFLPRSVRAVELARVQSLAEG